MKRKILTQLILIFMITISISACGKKTVTNTESIVAENNLESTVDTESMIAENDLESIVETETVSESIDFDSQEAQDTTHPVEDSNTNNIEEQPEVSEEERQAYYEAEQESLPDYLKDNQETTENSKPQKEVIKIYDPVKYPSFGESDSLPVTSESFAKEIRKNREIFEKYYNEESYGTYTKGKVEGELPYVGNTNYDGSVIIDAYTDKGFLIKYDTSTGRVYYSGMMLPTSFGFMDMASDNVLVQYCMDHMYNSRFDLTYAEMQQLLGTYNGN